MISPTVWRSLPLFLVSVFFLTYTGVSALRQDPACDVRTRIGFCAFPIDWSHPIEVSGTRRVFYDAKGKGRCTGVLNGTAVAPGADWSIVRNGTYFLDVRETVVTERGTAIYLQYKGVTKKDVPLDTFGHIRVSVTLETGDPSISYLHEELIVGMGRIVPGFAEYVFYTV